MNNTTVALKELTTVDLNAFESEVYANGRLIASIAHDENQLTQPWVVKINDAVVFQDTTQKRCHSFITWHYKEKTLPNPEPVVVEEPPAMQTVSESQQKQIEETPRERNDRLHKELKAACTKFGLRHTEIDWLAFSTKLYQGDRLVGLVGCNLDGQLYSRPKKYGPNRSAQSMEGAIALLVKKAVAA